MSEGTVEIQPEAIIPEKDYEIFEYTPSMSGFESAPIKTIDEKIRKHSESMFETMYARGGVGLASCQVGVAIRMAVVDISKEQKQPLLLINPEVLSEEGEQTFTEGCLSLPGCRRGKITRPSKITVKYQDLDGAWHELVAEDFLAQAIQHEIDHLDGVFYVDRMSKLERELILRSHKKKFVRAMKAFKIQAREAGIKI